MSADLKEFLVTFGQKYHREPHPKVKYADPDGWLSIMAYDYDQAREMAFQELGPSWSFIYERGVNKLDESHFPLGQLHQIVATKPPEPLTPHHSKTSGFTVVEVMIIIVIIGLLAAMAIPAIQKVRAERIRVTIMRGDSVSQAQRDYLKKYDAGKNPRPSMTYKQARTNYAEGDTLMIDSKPHKILKVDDFYVITRTSE